MDLEKKKEEKSNFFIHSSQINCDCDVFDELLVMFSEWIDGRSLCKQTAVQCASVNAA